jgi:hypothetical protein
MLKSLLSLLLSKFYSKKESALVAGQALPNERDYIQVTLATDQNTSYTAPEDGYLNICMTTGGSINVWGSCMQVSNFGLSAGQSKAFVPVRKGKVVQLKLQGEVLAANFYKLVGGGIKLLTTLFCKEVCYVA